MNIKQMIKIKIRQNRELIMVKRKETMKLKKEVLELEKELKKC